MAEDWAVDVRKYAPDADDAVIAGIVRYCGIALTKRDSSLVSFTDPKETGRVRDNFCRKKLGLTDSDADVDAAIARVGERMKGDKTRNRVTVYYLLAEAYDKLALFRGKAAAKTAADSSAAAAGAGLAAGAAAGAGLAAGANLDSSADTSTPSALTGSTGAANIEEPATAAGLAGAAGLAAAASAVPAAAAAPISTLAGDSHRDATPAAAAHRTGDESNGSGLGWLPWLAALLLGALLVWWLFGRGGDRAPAPAENQAASGTEATAPVAAAPAPVPQGSGVVAQEVEGKPTTSVYFDTGKTNISADFAAAVAPIKAWVDANPGARLAVSGFNDPTGNAALNAELSKNRAQAVAKALAGIGVPADKIDLVKPPETTDTNIDAAQARRVDIVVQGS